MKIVYSLLIVLILFSACNHTKNQSAEQENKKDTVETKQDTLLKDTALVDITQTILKHIKSKNYQSLTLYIHPQLGVRFSPYGYIDTVENVILKSDQFTNMINNGEKIVWGSYDGSGEEIRLTIKEYFAKFVYDVNFLKAEKLSVNKSVSQGNSINNIKEIYPNAEYTESYFSGFEKKYNGMDWRALRLVYKKEANKYYLIGIVHDQWTI